MAALTLGVSLPLALLLGFDASAGFDLLTGATLSGILALSAIGLAALVVAGRRLPLRDPVRLAAAITTIAGLALSAGALWRLARLQDVSSRPEELSAIDLQRRADLIQEDFKRLLSELDEPLTAAPALVPARWDDDRAFDLIRGAAARTRFLDAGRGLALYGPDGVAVAWAGASFPLPQDFLADLGEGSGTTVYRALAERHLTRLYALRRLGDRMMVAEVTIVSSLDPRLRDLALPRLQGDESARITLHDFRHEVTGFDQHLARHGDRYTGAAEGDRRTLYVGLRAPGGGFLGYALLTGLSAADLARRVERDHHLAAAAICTVLAFGLGFLLVSGVRAAAGGPHGVRHLAAALGVVWLVRLLFTWLPLSLTVAGGDLFGPPLFASARLYPLLRSPGDLLLTALAFLATGLLLHRVALRAAPARSIRGAVAGVLLLVGLVVASARILPRLASEMVVNASVNLLVVDVSVQAVAALVLQVSALLMLLALFQTAHGLLALSLPAGAPALLRSLTLRPGDPLSRWVLASMLPGMLLAGALYQPLFAPASERATEALYEDQLRPEVAGQTQARLALLMATLASLRQMDSLPDSLEIDEREQSSLALDLWQKTPLSGAGYSASLKVEDDEGAVLSRFAWNLPPAFDLRAREDPAVEAGTPALETSAFQDVRKNLLHVHHDVVSRSGIAGRVTVHILEEFDNLPFLTPETPYVRALAPRARRIATLPGSRRIWHTVYQPDGRTIFSNQRQAPPLRVELAELIADPSRSLWVSATDEGIPARYLFFGDGRHLFALGFSRATPLESIARALRTMLLGLAVLAALIAPPVLSSWGGRWRGLGRRVMQMLGRTQYRKLLTTFAFTTVLPLMALAILMQQYITREVDQEIEERGWQALRSASSLVRTVLVTDEQSELEDDMLYWIGQQVGHDVNMYQRGEITATSRRELFSSGLVSPRIDGEVYRRIVVEGRRVAMSRQTMRELPYRMITSPVAAGRARAAALLSLPLDAQTVDAERRAREVGDVVLITSVSMVLLVGIVGYALARRISRPIRGLRDAAARIAAGDLDATVAARASDETGDLIQTFNRMARALKEQREDLERRRDYIEKILQNATIGVVSTDLAGTVVTRNPAARILLDAPSLEPGCNLLQLVSSRPELEPLARLLQTGERGGDAELQLPGADPAGRTVRARAVPFLEGKGLILLLEDVTETVRSNRLAAWAEMARRIAHEIKNPLTPIQLSAEHIRRVHAESHPDFPRVLDECLRTIMEEVASLRMISAEFSTYARIPTPRKERVPVSELLADTIRPYQRAMPPGTALVPDIPPDLPVIEADRSLLTRALVNLIENALQAMPRGGELGVRARVGRQGDIEIDVSDTGTGMDAAALARIFEPYFSTKDAGTGLGLAIARKAVEEHGGRIEVTSAPESGTTMTIVLPVTRTTDLPPARAEAGRRST